MVTNSSSLQLLYSRNYDIHATTVKLHALFGCHYPLWWLSGYDFWLLSMMSKVQFQDAEAASSLWLNAITPTCYAVRGVLTAVQN